MANGDIAAAAGIPIVPPTDLVKNGYDQINRTLDLVVTRTPTVLPIGSGGTGGNTAAAARGNLGVVSQAGATIGIRWDQANLNFVPSVNGSETSPLLRLDQGDARYVRKSGLQDLLDQIERLTARVAQLETRKP